MENILLKQKIDKSKLTLNELTLNPKEKLNRRLKTDNYNRRNEKLPMFINKSESKKLNKINKNRENGKIKGKIYKYINCSYFKKSLGSIPSKTEKILINKNKNSVDRFSGPYSFFDYSKENTPGVGSYDLNYDWNLKNKAVKMESEEKRFTLDFNLHPGSGDYNLDNGENFQKERNNLRYNSLYVKTRQLFNDPPNKNGNSSDGGNILTYNPEILENILRNKKKFNFVSYSGRDDFRGSKIPNLFSKIGDSPGPGNYFSNITENYIKNCGSNYNNDKFLDNEKMKKSKKKLEKYLGEIRETENNKPTNFVMKQNGNKRDNKVYNLADIHNLYESNKIIPVDESKELEKLIKENEEKKTSNNLYFNISQNMELEKIKNILGNDNGKPDYFYLSPERWKIKKNAFRAPGPAYYFN